MARKYILIFPLRHCLLALRKLFASRNTSFHYSRVKWRPLFIYKNLRWRFNHSETKQKLKWKPYWNDPTSESKTVIIDVQQYEWLHIFSLLSLFVTRSAITTQVLTSKEILANDPRLRFAVEFFAAILKHLQYRFYYTTWVLLPKKPLGYYFQRIETITFFSTCCWK